MRIGSLFSGYGGLDLAAVDVFGGEVLWQCETDTAASRVLEHHWPHIPNLGDVTTVDWDALPPVDALIGGSPCQDVSVAGRRQGLRLDNRSGLIAHMMYAIDRLRPRIVVIENVRGLLSAWAASDVEPCPWCLGNGGTRSMRALGAVLGDLATRGYDARWDCVRAADVGAPHFRHRVFVVGVAREGDSTLARSERAVADADSIRLLRTGRASGWRPESTDASSGSLAHSDGEGLAIRSGVGHDVQPECEAAQRGRGPAVANAHGSGLRHQPIPDTRRGGAPVASAHGAGHAAHSAGDGREERLSELSGQRRQRVAGIDRLCVASNSPHGNETSGDALDEPPGESGRGGRRQSGTGVGDCAGDLAAGVLDVERGSERVDFGGYEPAIQQWERILGRAAPAPTCVGRRGAQVLNPVFVEWMMGLAHGWVTSVDGITRSDALRLLGNGVVWQQAAHAIRLLTPPDLVRSASALRGAS